jgi:hypothetical protein
LAFNGFKNQAMAWSAETMLVWGNGDFQGDSPGYLIVIVIVIGG